MTDLSDRDKRKLLPLTRGAVSSNARGWMLNRCGRISSTECRAPAHR